MRIDKFLKNSRIIKRRTVAKEACDGGRVKINDNVAKAGSEVKAGDLVEISFARGPMKFKVLSTPEIVKKDMAQDLYEVVEVENE